MTKMTKKVYVCLGCGEEYGVLPYGGDCERCPSSRMRAAIVCECGQRAWATLSNGVVYYRCVNGHIDGRIGKP